MSDGPNNQGIVATAASGGMQQISLEFVALNVADGRFF